MALALAVLLAGCAMPPPQLQPSQLLGSWRTEVVRTEWGPSILEVVFLNAQELEFKLTPAGTKQTMASKGSYRLSDGKLISEAMNKGSPVTLRLERDQLILKVAGQPARRFNRL